MLASSARTSSFALGSKPRGHMALLASAASEWRMFWKMRDWFSSANGVRPATSSYTRQPYAHTSTSRPWPFELRISGARYSGVPQSVYEKSPAGPGIFFANPKSLTLQ